MSEWHAFDRNRPEGLKDHYYYLVTHKDYKTPMKAKWHSENSGCWEVLGCIDDVWDCIREEFWYSWDRDNPITAWMELPDIYKAPAPVEFSDEQLKRLDILQEAAQEFFKALAETDDMVWNLEDTWGLIYAGADLLQARGRRVRIPTRVTDEGGKVYITDWGADPDADMEH